MLSRLLRDRLRPYSGLLVVVVVLQTIQTIAGLSLPTINARVIDDGVLRGDVGYIWTWGAVMLVLAVVQLGFGIAAMYVGGRIAMGFGRDVRGLLFHKVTDFSAREVGAFGAPSLITRITNDVQQVQMLVVMSCTFAIAAPITMVVGIFLALHQDVGLSVVLVVAVPIAGLTVGGLVYAMVPSFRAMQARIDEINRILREQITGIRVVRAFAREPKERDRFAVANRELTEVSVRAGRLMSAIFPAMNLVINLASSAVLWIGADRIASGEMQIGVVVAYLSYLVQILMSVLLATFVVSMLPRASVSAGRIVDVLDTDLSVVPPADPVSAMPTRGVLQFEGVAFHYPGAEAPVLSDVSFETRPGETTAIVGSTGGGKTTLVNLIPRLFDATSGAVRIGGVDVRDLDPDLVWQSIGLVPQRPYLFAGTVASNLRYGKPDATDEQLWHALEVAQAAAFVRGMPGDLDAQIDQGGANVSGGQRQRLSIARALVHEPDIYVFDDSFSALDLTTDARLRAALAPETREAAVVIVAQRISTIMGADQIVVLEEGKVVGRGRHDELLAGCETYAEIVQSQIGTREEPAT
jgi:ATP-binding cassette subfamily B multidrug efflux pump